MLRNLLLTFLPMLPFVTVGYEINAAELPGAIDPFVRSVDLNVGESAVVELSNGRQATIKLLDLQETRDDVCFAVRRAEVTVAVNGRKAKLVAANYQLPQTVGGVQVDCAVTSGYNANGTPSFWGLKKAARLRLWPADSPWIRPDTFTYPVLQRWFATDTQMANEPVHVDGGDRPGKRKIYYHSGLDIGGSEGLVEVVAATDSVVVSVGEVVLEGHRRDTPVSPRYDVVYLLDGRGWYYRYSHLKEIDKQLVPGRIIAQGTRVGRIGKEGGSGGWSHLHFEIKSRQPSGAWGTQEGYAFLWEAYRRRYDPRVIAVARPHQLVWAGQTVTLDGSQSWAASGKISRYEWSFDDETSGKGPSDDETSDKGTSGKGTSGKGTSGKGTSGKGPRVPRRYTKPGRYCETLKVTDDQGNTAYDFAVVVVADREHPERLVPTIHANFSPTHGIRPNDAVTFKVRTFNTQFGKETWDFGDGTPSVVVQSDGNAVKLAADGYATTTHRFAEPGDYLVRVERVDEHGVRAVGRLHVRVASDGQTSRQATPTGETQRQVAQRQHAAQEPTRWARLAPHFAVPKQFADDFGDYHSPLQFADGSLVRTKDDWKRRREEIVSQWTEMLGRWPDLIRQPRVEVLESQRRDGFTQHRIRFLWTPEELTTGYLLVPDGEGKRPAVLTVYYEPETAVGLRGEHRDFAYQLARRGFVALSIGTTEATAAKTYALYYPSLNDARVQPLSMLGCAAANAWHVLAARPEVDANRIGIVGHSFGGKWALFGGCLFDKFAAVAVSDPGIMLGTHPSVNYWEPWYLGWHPQPWRKRGLVTQENPARGLYPRLLNDKHDLHELHALLAGRPFLVSGGEVDPPQRWRALNHLVKLNHLLGHEHLVGMTNRPKHSPTPESNAVIYGFFEHFLK